MYNLYIHVYVRTYVYVKVLNVASVNLLDAHCVLVQVRLFGAAFVQVLFKNVSQCHSCLHSLSFSICLNYLTLEQKSFLPECFLPSLRFCRGLHGLSEVHRVRFRFIRPAAYNYSIHIHAGERVITFLWFSLDFPIWLIWVGYWMGYSLHFLLISWHSSIGFKADLLQSSWSLCIFMCIMCCWMIVITLREIDKMSIILCFKLINFLRSFWLISCL